MAEYFFMKPFLLNLLIIVLISSCTTYQNQYLVYDGLSSPKAKAVAVRQNGQYWQLTGGWGVGSDSTIEKAIQVALNNCSKFNPYNTCVIEKVDSTYVLEQNIAKLKLQPYQQRQSSQGVDWARAASVLGGQILDMEKARTTPVLPTPSQPISQGTTYFYDSEQRSGMNKICFYRFGSSYATETVSAASICPRTIIVK